MMDVHLVTDDAGEIIAVYKGKVAGPTEAVPSSVGFVARHGQRVHELTLPPELDQEPLEQIHKTMRVHLSEGETALRPKTVTEK